MTVFTWALRLIIFFILVVFALQNTDPINLHLLPGQIWQAPLVIILLAFFSGGAVLGALSLLGLIYRQRREISRLKRASTLSKIPEPLAVPPVV
jgi:lipopolysaccharide assembly protein A